MPQQSLVVAGPDLHPRGAPGVGETDQFGDRLNVDAVSRIVTSNTVVALQRVAANLTLAVDHSAPNAPDDAALTLAAGATLATDPRGTLSLASDSNIFINGMAKEGYNKAFAAALAGLFVLSGQASAAIWFTPAAAWAGAVFFGVAAVQTPRLGSRGVAVAVRLGWPVRCPRALMDQVGVEVEAGGADEVEAFRAFLDSVSAEDFEDEDPSQ